MITLIELKKYLSELSYAERGKISIPTKTMKPIYDAIILYTNFLNSNADIRERTYCVVHNIISFNDIPKCKNCNKLTTFGGYSKGYLTYCSRSCSTSYNTKGRKMSEKNKIALINGIKKSAKERTDEDRKKIALKTKKTRLKKYGVEHLGSSENTKKGWSHIINKLNKIDIRYTKEVINTILNSEEYFYEKYFGRAKNRTLINDDPVLYLSIMESTEYMIEYFKHNKNMLRLRNRLLLAGKYNYTPNFCQCGSRMLFESEANEVSIFCSKCMPGPNSKQKFKVKYGNNWEEEYVKFWLSMENNVFTSYSKVSQEVFDSIYNLLPEDYKKHCIYATRNFEYRYTLNKNQRKELQNKGISNMVYYLDFKCNNKIIEFNGSYWHRNSEVADSLKKLILERDENYDVLFIDELEYYANKNEIINNCVNFILG